MKSIGLNPDKCRVCLKTYAAEIEQLLALVGDDDTSKTLPSIILARDKLRQLKERLKRDHRLRSSLEARHRMTPVEALIFAPAMQRAAAHLQISSKSMPTREWLPPLAESRTTIQQALEQLDRWSAK